MLLLIIRVIYLLICAGAIAAYTLPQDTQAPAIVREYPVISFCLLMFLAMGFLLVDVLVRKKRIEVVSAIYFGLLIGIWTAARQYGWTDKILTFVVLIGISIPSFWLGLLLILLFAVNLRWLPASGMYAIYGGGDLADLLKHLILPATTLAVVATGVIARLTRGAMLEVLRQDFIRTARAKGVSERDVLYKHAFKAALVGIIPVIGVQAGFVLGGAVYIETVFQWPGAGRMLVQAISTRDILLVQGGVVVVAASYVLFNLAADLAQSWLDPRVKT